jgi:hypothetical protein
MKNQRIYSDGKTKFPLLRIFKERIIIFENATKK